MNARLRSLTLEDVDLVRLWREHDDTRAGLRRSEPLTKERQEQWYRDVVCRPDLSPHRYWAVEVSEGGIPYDRDMTAVQVHAFYGWQFVGQVSLESIDPHIKAEIGLITDPALHGKGLGRAALELLLARGFDEYGLKRIWGVCYWCNHAIGFWQKMLREFGGVALPGEDWTETRVWAGVEHPSLRFWFTVEAWRERLRLEREAA